MRRSGGVAVLLAMMIQWLPASAGGFQEPNTAGFGIDAGKLTLAESSRSYMSAALAKCCGAMPANDSRSPELQAKLLGLALLVNPNCAAAEANLKRLKDGVPVQADAIWTPAKVAQSLVAVAGTLTGPRGSDNGKLAGFCYSLAADLAPGDDAVMAAASRFGKENGAVNWTAVLLPAPTPPMPGVTPDRLVITAGIQARGEDEAADFMMQQGLVSGLVVVDVLGRPSGRTLDILGTVYPHQVPNKVLFELATDVGGEMKISFDEALSLVQTRHPNLRGGKKLRISFSDKYTPKDGGSAGLAFSLLLFSMYDGLQLDPDLAVTGDVTVDWKVRGVGAVAAKITGARECGKRLALIPASNRSAVEDMIVMDGVEALFRTQVLAAETVAEAVEIARIDRLPDLQSALNEFAKLQQAAETHGVAKLLGMSAAQKVLADIAAKAPAHLSASYLARTAKGWRPATLSRDASITEIATVYIPFARDIRFVSFTQRPEMDALLVESKYRCEKLRVVSCEEVKPLAAALAAYFSASLELRLHQSTDGSLAELLRKKDAATASAERKLTPLKQPGKTINSSQQYHDVRQAATAVQAELAKLSLDREFIEALTR